jgi:hypothetical protein
MDCSKNEAQNPPFCVYRLFQDVDKVFEIIKDYRKEFPCRDFLDMDAIIPKVVKEVFDLAWEGLTNENQGLFQYSVLTFFRRFVFPFICVDIPKVVFTPPVAADKIEFDCYVTGEGEVKFPE